MKLQLSLDLVEMDDALLFIEETKDSIDIIEIGTPFALKYGLRAITEIKEKYPDKELLADYKIVDGGNYEANIAFKAGADIVTVLGVSDDITIAGAVSAAKSFHRKIMVDLIGISEIEKRILAIEKLGVDYVCVHTALDVQNGLNSPIEQLRRAKEIVNTSELAVAGGIRIENIDEVIQYKPRIIIVGAGITSKPDRSKAAADIKKKLDKSIYAK